MCIRDRVGRAGVLTDSINKIKKVIFHPEMLPKSVICDPNLSLKLPQKLTAGTGMDAFAHCLEAYCSPGYHPMADGIALEGMKLIKNSLVVAYQDGKNIEARQNLLAASSMGSTAFQKGLGAIHSLSHPVNAQYNIHHGLSNAIFMPYVLTFNKSIIEKKTDFQIENSNLIKFEAEGNLNNKNFNVRARSSLQRASFFHILQYFLFRVGALRT